MEFCRSIGCSRSTFYHWIKEHNEIAEAFKNGRELGKKIWLKRCIIPEGKLPNTSLHRLLATNIYGLEFLPQKHGIKHRE